MTARSIALHPSIPAIAYCQGTPLRGEINARDGESLPAATDIAAQAIAARFDEDAVDEKIEAHTVLNRA